jgi:hypothetical protein
MRLARFAVPLMFLLSACGSIRVGQEFDLSAFEAKVQRGVTTQAEVRALLGAPTGVGISVETSGERYEQWTYYEGEGHLPNLGDARFKILQIKFDQAGVARAYNWSGEQK